jgi:hypothetical protein
MSELKGAWEINAMNSKTRLYFVATSLFLSGFGSRTVAQQIRMPSPRPVGSQVAGNAQTSGTSKPSKPTNLSVVGGGNQEIDLQWDASTEQGGTIAKYQIFICDKPKAQVDADSQALSLNCDHFRVLDTSPTNTYSATNLTNNNIDVRRKGIAQGTHATKREKTTKDATSTDESKTPEEAEGVKTLTNQSLEDSRANTTNDLSTLVSKSYGFAVMAIDATGNKSEMSTVIWAETASSKITCWIIPGRPTCMDFGVNDPSSFVDHRTKLHNNVNQFYQMNGSYSFFNQIKSVYNGAAGSATVAADLGTLNLSNAVQVTVTTNAQTGSFTTTSSPATGAGAAAALSPNPAAEAVTSSVVFPTLTANGAAQATQNIIYGGTFLVSEVYPLFAAGSSRWGAPGGLGLLIDGIAREGADIQNFKSGTNVNVTSPPFHASGQIEGYLQFNSINLLPQSQNFAGSVFLGGAYGYNYMSHGYARDYGFGNSPSNGVGQFSLGILLNGVAKITVSRAFGPSQTYVNSATGIQTTVNNFKAWSFSVSYQSGSHSK